MESYPLGSLENGLDKVHRQMSRNHSAPGRIHLREAIGHIWPQTLSICCAGSPCKLERVIWGS